MMITKFLLPILFLGSLVFGQSGPINEEKGIANQGYDVVSYFFGKPLEGSSKFAIKYQGITYYFQNNQNKSKFQQSPIKYLPQYGGYCAFAMGDSGKKVSINPQTYKITNGKLYLFYNRLLNNTLTDWNKDERNLTIKADKNWRKLLAKW